MTRHAREARPVAQAGVALLEVVVALGILAVGVLGVAAALDAAVRTLGTAAAARRALVTAQAAAYTSVGTSTGWQTVSTGTGGPTEDGAASSPAPPCQRRTIRSGGSSGPWFWIEAHCGPGPPIAITPSVAPGSVGAARLAVPR